MPVEVVLPANSGRAENYQRVNPADQPLKEKVMEIRRGKKKIEEEETVKVNVAPEPVFEPVKTQKIIEKMMPIVVATVDVNGETVKELPSHALVLTEKRGFKFVSRILSKGTHDECTLAMSVYRKKFGVSRNEKLFVAKA